jgi:hypothetical protein
MNPSRLPLPLRERVGVRGKPKAHIMRVEPLPPTPFLKGRGR